jgi:hypothetical protein
MTAQSTINLRLNYPDVLQTLQLLLASACGRYSTSVLHSGCALVCSAP